MLAHMMTRRAAVGTGLAIAAAASTAGFSVFGSNWLHHPNVGAIDALFVDQTLVMPQKMAAFIKVASQTMPIVEIRLDAATHTELMRMLGKSNLIWGISSGATLFCLERMAWDHGFRMTERSERHVSVLGNDTDQADMAEFLGAGRPAAAGRSALRVYRPSRADGMLHSWIMRKPANDRPFHVRREI